MNVYKIPDTLSSNYKGAGYAIASIANGELVALRYLDDVMPNDVADKVADGGPHVQFFIRQCLGTSDAGHVVREMQALGQVSVGMCSAWEFCEV